MVGALELVAAGKVAAAEDSPVADMAVADMAVADTLVAGKVAVDRVAAADSSAGSCAHLCVGLYFAPNPQNTPRKTSSFTHGRKHEIL